MGHQFDNLPHLHESPQGLMLEAVLLADILEHHETPLYVYSRATMLDNIRALQAAFPDATIHYSMKANANLNLLRLIYHAGFGMDAVSAGEIVKAIHAGIPAQQIVFAGVGKSPAEIRFALKQGVGWFNVENVTELETIERFAREIGTRPQVALRFNPDVLAKTHESIATGHSGAKFGLSQPEIEDISARSWQAVQIKGLHVHIGSQLHNIEATVSALQKTLALPLRNFQVLNIGGGFPVAYEDDRSYPSLQDFAAAIAPFAVGKQLKLEPGRFVLANAGLLLTQVLYRKARGQQQFCIVDASMTELLRPALYHAYHAVLPISAHDSELQEAFSVVGPVCETTDILNPSAMLPADLQPGDTLAILHAGAYGMVMASNYNQRPRPAEILVDGDQWRMIRQRETWQSLMQFEVLEDTP